MSISEHINEFRGLPVREYAGQGLPDVEKNAWRIGTAYEDGGDAFADRLDALAAEPDADKVEALVFGVWFEDWEAEPPTQLIASLIDHRDRFKSLKGIFLGDIVSEETEISWLAQADQTPLLDAYPHLEDHVARGASGEYAPEGHGLRFTNLRHANLRSLTVQSGGLSSECVTDIANAELPSLERLSLWLGSENYGGDWTMDDLGPIFQAEGLPNLRHLGLCDSERSDDIAKAIVEAPVLDQLESLDLSMGTLGDEGAKALLASDKVRKLKSLNLRHHYMSEATEAKFAEKMPGVEINLADRQQEEVYEYQGETHRERYCEVSE